MSISAESLHLHEPGEPDEVIFAQLRSEAEELLSGRPPANTADWYPVPAESGVQLVNVEPVVKRLPSRILTLMPGEGENVTIDLVRRVPAPWDYTEKRHTFTVGTDIASSSHLLSVQDFEFTFGKQHALTEPDYAVGEVDRDSLIGIREILEDIIYPKAPKERLLRRAARWLLRH